MEGVAAVTDWTFTGLIYDIAGVLVLGYALAWSSDIQLYRHAGTYYGGNRVLFAEFIVRRADAWFGLMLLVVGFGQQILGAAATQFPSLGWDWSIGVLALLFVLFVGVRDLESDRALRYFFKRLESERK